MSAQDNEDAEIIDEEEEESLNSDEEEEEKTEDEDDEVVSLFAKGLVWSDVTHKQLAKLLSTYGLDINSLERVIVTQHRRAVEVADPKKLVRFIEQLIGGGGAEKELEMLTTDYVAAEAENARLDDQYDALVSKSEELNPALQQWKRFNESNLEYHERLATASKKRAMLLEKEAEIAKKEAEEAETQLQIFEGAQEAARIKADELLVVKEEADEVAAAAVAKEKQAAQEQQVALEVLERAQVREKAASTALKRAQITVSNTVATLSAENDLQKKKTKAGNGKAAASAEKIKQQLEEKAENLESEIAAVQEELDGYANSMEALQNEEGSGDENLSKEVLAARAAWKQAQDRADAASAAAHVAAEKSSQAAVAASNALSTLKKQENVELNAEKAVEKCDSLINSLSNNLNSLETEERLAFAAAQDAENELAAHQVEGIKLLETLQRTSKAMQDAGIDEEDSQYSPQNNNNNGASGSSSRQSVDAAVAALAQQAQQDDLNPLTSAFHGRIHSVLRVLAPQATTAANAVLLEKCNPASTLVTSTRTAAEVVVGYFKDNKVGVASCNVLEELSGTNSNNNGTRSNSNSSGKAVSSTASAASKLLAPVLNGTPGALCPLSSLIQANTKIPGSSVLSADMFSNWYVISDPLAAAKVREQENKDAAAAAARANSGGNNKKKNQKKRMNQPNVRRNLVTLCGSVFKSDGEICAPKDPTFIKSKEKYLLGSSFVDIGSSSSGTSSNSSLVDTSKYEEMAEKLKAEHAMAVAAVDFHELGADEINDRTAAAHAALASKHAAIASTKSKFEGVLRAMQKESKVLDTARTAVEKALSSHSAAAAKAKNLKTACLESEALAKKCVKEATKLYGMYVDAAKGDLAAQRALENEHAVAELRFRSEDAEQRKLALETQLTSIWNSITRLDKAFSVLETAEKAVLECTNTVSEATLAAAAAGEKLEHAQEALDEAFAAKNLATLNWRDSVHGHQLALESHQKTLAVIQDARALQATFLQNAINMSKASAEAQLQVTHINEKLTHAGVALNGVPELEDIGEEESEKKENKKSGAGKEAADDGHDDDEAMNEEADDGPSLAEYLNSTSSSDIEDEQTNVKRRRGSGTIPAVRRGGATAGELINKKAVATTAAAPPAAKLANEDSFSSDGAVSIEPMETNSTSESEWEEDEITSAMAELAEQKRALEKLAHSIDTAAATEAMHVYAQLISLKKTLQTQDNKVQRLAVKLVEARSARYTQFSTAMDAAAEHLSRIYQRLTGNLGDAACYYAKDEHSVFEQGVTFKVRPDNGPWRMFSALSGGQQALAALSLCFAFQKIAPSPFYFFDEIDAALDTINSQRVAEFLRDACDSMDTVEDAVPPQIIAVSHRKAPQEAARCLLGVYPATQLQHQQNNTTYNNTEVMTYYPAFYRGEYILNNEDTGEQRLVHIDDAGKVFMVDAEEVFGEGLDYEFAKQMLQLLGQSNY
jgi:chromosome segregation ATPase